MKMKLKRLWCVLVIIAFSSPVFAAPVVPGQIDSMDDINDTNWVEATAGWNGTYMEQVLVGGANEVYEGIGSMKIDFTQYPGGAPYRDETFRQFDPGLDLSNYENLAITFWVWTIDANDTRLLTLDSRLKEIIVTDSSFIEYSPHLNPWPYYEGNIGRFAVPPLKNVGWNKVIAPLRNFLWTDDPWELGGSNVHRDDVDWTDITNIGLLADTNTIGDNNAIYIDDMQFELILPQSLPYQVATFDDIWDELWEETHNSVYMRQTLPGDPNFKQGSSSMRIDYNSNPDGIGTLPTDSVWDLTPKRALIPALDFNDGNDWAITMWVWSDLPGVYGQKINDSYLWEIDLYDASGQRGFYRVPRQDWDAGTGWTKVTARIDEFLWESGFHTPSSFADITASQADLDAIVAIGLWAMDYPYHGNNVYFDDLQIEPAVEALSEAVVYNADYAPPGTITVDGNTPDWDTLVDSDIIDFNLADPTIRGYPTGNLHVQYRLAWDPNYLYILVEEQPCDDLANEATHTAKSAGGLAWGLVNTAGTLYDSLALSFDFTNDKLPSVDVHMALYLVLGLSSAETTDLMIAYGNPRGIVTRWDTWNELIDNDGYAATGGTLGSRVIEAKLKWTELESEIDSWFKPAGGFAAAVKAGYIFGCDPHLQDLDNNPLAFDADHGTGWFSGRDNAIQWAQGNYRWPSGKDKYSTDIRLVCSAGDLDFDCEVNFVDYAQFAAEWFIDDCNSINDFCNGADIVINGDVGFEDLDRFTERWLDGF